MGTQRRALSLALLAVRMIGQCLANAPFANRPHEAKNLTTCAGSCSSHSSSIMTADNLNIQRYLTLGERR